METITMNRSIEERVLSYEDACTFFYYDPYTGKVFWKERVWREGGDFTQSGINGFNTRFADRIAGRTNKPYPTAAITHNGVHYRDISISRLAWLLHYGSWPTGLVRHLDGDSLNNSINNLVSVTRAEVQQSIRKNSSNTSGFQGVSKPVARAHLSRPWVAMIQNNGSRYYLGVFETKHEAAERYELARNWFGHSKLDIDLKPFKHDSGLTCARRGYNGD